MYIFLSLIMTFKDSPTSFMIIVVVDDVLLFVDGLFLLVILFLAVRAASLVRLRVMNPASGPLRIARHRLVRVINASRSSELQMVVVAWPTLHWRRYPLAVEAGHRSVDVSGSLSSGWLVFMVGWTVVNLFLGNVRLQGIVLAFGSGQAAGCGRFSPVPGVGWLQSGGGKRERWKPDVVIKFVVVVVDHVLEGGVRCGG